MSHLRLFQPRKSTSKNWMQLSRSSSYPSLCGRRSTGSMTLPSLSGGLDGATVDHGVDAGDVSGHIGQQERDQGRHLFGFGHAAGGDVLVFRHLLDEFGEAHAGRSGPLADRAVGVLVD